MRPDHFFTNSSRADHVTAPVLGVLGVAFSCFCEPPFELALSSLFCGASGVEMVAVFPDSVLNVVCPSFSAFSASSTAFCASACCAASSFAALCCASLRAAMASFMASSAFACAFWASVFCAASLSCVSCACSRASTRRSIAW